jgi:hypothetical protein
MVHDQDISAPYALYAKMHPERGLFHMWHYKC